MALLDDLKSHLVAQGVDESGAWDIVKSYMPEDSSGADKDKVIAVFETGGPPPDQTPVTAHDFPTFQVRVRAGEHDYSTARDKIQAVFDALNDATISGLVYVFATSGVIPLGRDRNNRPELVQNYKTMKER